MSSLRKRLSIVVVLVMSVGLASCSATGGGGNTTTQFDSVSVGGGHVCALDTNGNAYCWGHNLNGQLGNDTVNSTSQPTPVSGGIQFDMISAGILHTCGISTAGKLYCWGDESYGKVGNGQITGNQLTPVEIDPGDAPFASVSAGTDQTCAVKQTGAVLCWGATWDGELGLGAYVPGVGGYGGNPQDLHESLPTPTEITTFPYQFAATRSTLSAGGQHACAVAYSASGGDAQVYCWGNNYWAAVSPYAPDFCDWTPSMPRPPFPCSVLPVPIGYAQNTLYHASSVTAGGDFSCDVNSAYVVACWGNDDLGQLGSDASTQTPCPYGDYFPTYCRANPTFVLTGPKLEEISAGYQFVCGLAAPGTSPSVWCWGADGSGQLGTTQNLANMTCTTSAGNMYHTPCVSYPVGISATFTAVQVSAGADTACVVTTDRRLYCWGSNLFGQLGPTVHGSLSPNPTEITP